jgi:hypothetical protein
MYTYIDKMVQSYQSLSVDRCGVSRREGRSPAAECANLGSTSTKIVVGRCPAVPVATVPTGRGALVPLRQGQ